MQVREERSRTINEWKQKINWYIGNIWDLVETTDRLFCEPSSLSQFREIFSQGKEAVFRKYESQKCGLVYFRKSTYKAACFFVCCGVNETLQPSGLSLWHLSRVQHLSNVFFKVLSIIAVQGVFHYNDSEIMIHSYSSCNTKSTFLWQR